MKIVGIFLILGLLFSYLPIIPTDGMNGCPQGNQTENHTGNKKMDCGYIFHCPLIFDGALQEPLPLPLNGLLPLPSILSKVDELAHFIFHPPKNQIISNSQG
jgi:hypothetical protein